MSRWMIRYIPRNMHTPFVLYFVLIWLHNNDVIMGAMASQITSLAIVYSTVYSRRRSKETSKLRVTGLCEGNSPVTGGFPAPRASNAKKSIWWRHHVDTDWFHTCSLWLLTIAFVQVKQPLMKWINRLPDFTHKELITAHKQTELNKSVFIF